MAITMISIIGILVFAIVACCLGAALSIVCEFGIPILLIWFGYLGFKKLFKLDDK